MTISLKQIHIASRISLWAKKLLDDICALYLALKQARLTIASRALIAVVVAYALSPIDFIPDFIPVLGLLDELLLLPLGIWLAIRLIPPDEWIIYQNRARQQRLAMPVNNLAAILISGFWLITLFAILFCLSS